MMHKIDHKVLLEKVNEMINLLEYDSSRSAGKCKLNAGHLDALYNLKERYEAILKKTVKKIKEDK